MVSLVTVVAGQIMAVLGVLVAVEEEQTRAQPEQVEPVTRLIHHHHRETTEAMEPLSPLLVVLEGAVVRVAPEQMQQQFPVQEI